MTESFSELPDGEANPDDAHDGQAGAEEVSLERLSRAFAEVMGTAAPASRREGEAADEADGESGHPAAGPLGRWSEQAGQEPPDVAAAGGEVSPRSVLEALLFVGDPANEPLTAQRAAALMRGVEADEVHGLVQELNRRYAANGCPYYVASSGAGYRLQLREEFQRLQQNFYGRVRRVRLSQAAVDVLALVAYRQPMTRHDVERLRGYGSAAVLSQLVRRRLLRIERSAGPPRTAHYFTTRRFLELFGLESLGDLPRSQELEPG